MSPPYLFELVDYPQGVKGIYPAGRVLTRQYPPFRRRRWPKALSFIWRPGAGIGLDYSAVAGRSKLKQKRNAAKRDSPAP